MLVVDMLRAAQHDATHNATALDILSMSRSNSAEVPAGENVAGEKHSKRSSSDGASARETSSLKGNTTTQARDDVQARGEPISKRLLTSLFEALNDQASSHYLYVGNEYGSNFFHGLVIPLLARIIAVSCPGILCIVQLPTESSAPATSHHGRHNDHAAHDKQSSEESFEDEQHDASRTEQGREQESDLSASRSRSRIAPSREDYGCKEPEPYQKGSSSDSQGSTPSPLASAPSSVSPIESTAGMTQVSATRGAAGSARAAGTVAVLNHVVASSNQQTNRSRLPVVAHSQSVSAFDSHCALRLVCNGFEVLTGRVPAAGSTLSKCSLAAVSWKRAGVITPSSRDKSVEMMFSNGMVSVTEGIVVSYTNGSLCHLSIQSWIHILKSVPAKSKTPILFFTFRERGNMLLSELLSSDANAYEGDKLLSELHVLVHSLNIFFVEIGCDSPVKSDHDGKNRNMSTEAHTSRMPTQSVPVPSESCSHCSAPSTHDEPACKSCVNSQISGEEHKRKDGRALVSSPAKLGDSGNDSSNHVSMVDKNSRPEPVSENISLLRKPHRGERHNLSVSGSRLTNGRNSASSVRRRVEGSENNFTVSHGNDDAVCKNGFTSETYGAGLDMSSVVANAVPLFFNTKAVATFPKSMYHVENDRGTSSSGQNLLCKVQGPGKGQYDVKQLSRASVDPIRPVNELHSSCHNKSLKDKEKMRSATLLRESNGSTAPNLMPSKSGAQDPSAGGEGQVVVSDAENTHCKELCGREKTRQNNVNSTENDGVAVWSANEKKGSESYFSTPMDTSWRRLESTACGDHGAMPGLGRGAESTHGYNHASPGGEVPTVSDYVARYGCLPQWYGHPSYVFQHHINQENEVMRLRNVATALPEPLHHSATFSLNSSLPSSHHAANGLCYHPYLTHATDPRLSGQVPQNIAISHPMYAHPQAYPPTMYPAAVGPRDIRMPHVLPWPASGMATGMQYGTSSRLAPGLADGKLPIQLDADSMYHKCATSTKSSDSADALEALVRMHTGAASSADGRKCVAATNFEPDGNESGGSKVADGGSVESEEGKPSHSKNRSEFRKLERRRILDTDSDASGTSTSALVEPAEDGPSHKRIRR